eukprot:gb/GECG01006377.1/.p1 GENE.gb/GECG01006377.1/~~gb/GECG01006377.1/.p1  ORF type:complete len:944 (+),score=137.93 gb/GECG01006377.1/:1-2832(+)
MLAAPAHDQYYYSRTQHKGRASMPSTTSSRGHRLVSSVASNGVSSPSFSSTGRSLTSYLSPQGSNAVLLGHQKHQFDQQQNRDGDGKIMSSSHQFQNPRYTKHRPEGSGRARALMQQANFCLSKEASKATHWTESSLEKTLQSVPPRGASNTTTNSASDGTSNAVNTGIDAWEMGEEMPYASDMEDNFDADFMSPEFGDDKPDEILEDNLNDLPGATTNGCPNKESDDSYLGTTLQAHYSSTVSTVPEEPRIQCESFSVSSAASLVPSEPFSPVSTSDTTCLSPTFTSPRDQSRCCTAGNLETHQSSPLASQSLSPVPNSGPATTATAEPSADISKGTPNKRNSEFSSPCSNNSSLTTSAKKKKKRVRFVEGDVSDNSADHLSPQPDQHESSVRAKEANDGHSLDEASSNPAPSSYDTPEKEEPSTSQSTVNQVPSPPKQTGSVRSRLLQRRIRRNTDMAQCFVSPQKTQSAPQEKGPVKKSTTANGGGRRGKLLLSSAICSGNTEHRQCIRSSVSGASADSTCSRATQVNTEQARSSQRPTNRNRSLSRSEKLEAARSKWQRIIRGENIDDIFEGECNDVTATVSPTSSSDSATPTTNDRFQTLVGSPQSSATGSSKSDSDVFEFVSSPPKTDNSTAGATPPPVLQSWLGRNRNDQSSPIKMALSFDNVDMQEDSNEDNRKRGTSEPIAKDTTQKKHSQVEGHENEDAREEQCEPRERKRRAKRSRNRVLRELRSHNSTGEYWSDAEQLQHQALHLQEPSGCCTRRKRQAMSKDSVTSGGERRISQIDLEDHSHGSKRQSQPTSDAGNSDQPSNAAGEESLSSSKRQSNNCDGQLENSRNQRDETPVGRPSRTAKLASSREKYGGSLMATVGSAPASPASRKRAKNQTNQKSTTPQSDVVAGLAKRPRRSAASESARQRYASRDVTLGTAPIGSNLRCGQFT